MAYPTCILDVDASIPGKSRAAHPTPPPHVLLLVLRGSATAGFVFKPTGT